jgi:uncharacterized membrane protein
MEQFAYTEYRQVEVPAYVGAEAETLYYTPSIQTIPIVHESVPDGLRAVYLGMPVHAADGYVGELDELLTDPETGQVTYLVLREGHLWGKKQALVPVSMVKSATEGMIRLKAERKTIASLLAIPAKKRYGVSAVELMLWTYDGPGEAQGGLAALGAWTKEQPGTVLAAALVAKDADGKASLQQLGDVDKRHGALYGALAGGLSGLVAGPAGVLLGAAAGAVAGRTAAKRIDLGFPDEFLVRIEEGVEPDTAAVLALVEGSDVDEVAQAMSGSDGVLMQVSVTDEMLARHVAALEMD